MPQIGLEEALNLVRQLIVPLESEAVSSLDLVGRVCARDVHAVIDYPSIDVSMKDGYALFSEDVARASSSTPVSLKLVGTVGAGDSCNHKVRRSTAVRIFSGAPIPEGADAVLAEEFAEPALGGVRAFATAESGRNILRRGSEVAAGETLVAKSEVFTPAKVSLLVAGGLDGALVFRRPIVGLMATGNEVLLPGAKPKTGKLFASNLLLQSAWLKSWSVECRIARAADSFEGIASVIESMWSMCDVVLTSGGAWKGDRDLTVKVLDQLGWRQIFHRVRMGPGKAVAMGFLRDKPVFCLPGGPPSNEAAFLLVAMPAVLRMSGYERPPAPVATGILGEDVSGQRDWTQVVHCRVEDDDSAPCLFPLASRRRLNSMARADGLFLIPEGTDFMPAGSSVRYLRLSMCSDSRRTSGLHCCHNLLVSCATAQIR